MILGESPSLAEINKQLTDKPEIGYRIIHWIKNKNEKEYQNILEKIKEEEIEILVISREIKKNPTMLKMLYETLALGVKILDEEDLYEIIFQKIPINELEEGWFVQQIQARAKLYDNLKRILDLLLSLLVFIILSPIIVLIFIFIGTTSSGPVIYSQNRVGRKEKEFTLYKFRTMRKDAEAGGPQWSKEKDDRVTPIGKILRHTHLDEIPQLINIIRGELSFVGPRPERPEFVSLLREKIPYYDIRHIVKPGLTGFAQINYRYGSSVEDAYKKLEYDVYYIKNRSFILDALIILKTIRLIFKNH
jgi:exopolysaccharide biosynthesis polyprenyl glycosylphosphotransferase